VSQNVSLMDVGLKIRDWRTDDTGFILGGNP